MPSSGHFARPWLRQSISAFFPLFSKTSASASLPPASGSPPSPPSKSPSPTPLSAPSFSSFASPPSFPERLPHFPALSMRRPFCEALPRLFPSHISWLPLPGAVSRSRLSVEVETEEKMATVYRVPDCFLSLFRWEGYLKAFREKTIK